MEQRAARPVVAGEHAAREPEGHAAGGGGGGGAGLLRAAGGGGGEWGGAWVCGEFCWAVGRGWERRGEEMDELTL